MPLPYQDATQLVTNNGLRTQYGVVIPPGAKVAAFVRSASVSADDGNDEFLVQNLCTTLAQGIARARPGRGDFVIVLPGHVESVTDATTFSNALVAGVKIVGVGRGSNMPTFTWTQLSALWAVNKADVSISGVRIAVSTNNVVNGIAVTAADFGFYNNEVIPGNGAVTFTSSAVQIAAGGDRADLVGNTARAVAPGAGVPLFDITGVVADVRIADNEAIFGAGAAVGIIRVTAVAATGLRILRNTLYNTTAASTVCINIGAAANDGIVAYNNLAVLNNGTASAQGILFGAGSLVRAFQNFTSDEPQKSGLLAPVAAT